MQVFLRGAIVLVSAATAAADPVNLSRVPEKLRQLKGDDLWNA